MEEKYLKADNTVKYNLLARMLEDCKYYLGAGNKQIKYLWSGNVDDHIRDMEELYRSFPIDERPDWISMYDIHTYSKQMDHRPVIDDSYLGKARYIDLFRKKEKRGLNEVFFTIEKREGPNKHGYVDITPEMKRIFDTLFQDNKSNMHIDFIEWEDSYNAVFNDGIYISSKMCRIEKSDFAKWESSIAK